MCGIAGVFGRQDEPTVAAMLATLTHRGPDDGYLLSRGTCTLGARRLSILDVEGGRQPLGNEDGSVIAAQNGEIYNSPGLADGLRQAGHTLLTHCDTEVLPHLYEERGERFVQQLDGMFAVSLWDSRLQLGLLARDRVGKKPLYYTLHDGALYFASEIKALLAIPGFQRRINPAALGHFLTLRHVPKPLSIFEGIRCLPPAHVLVFEAGRIREITRYWRPSFAPTAISESSLPDLVDELLEKLREAVRKRLLSDVPIGFFLSGGIDSSLTSALAAEVSNAPIQAFTLTYGSTSSTPGKESDRYWAREIARQFDMEHFEEEISVAHYPESLRRIIQCFDEPFAGTTSTYFLAERMARHVKVAISGDGADELFGSYASHRLAIPLGSPIPGNDIATLATQYSVRESDLREYGGLAAAEWRYRQCTFSDEEKQELLARDYREEVLAHPSRTEIAAYFDGLTAGGDPLNCVLEAEFHSLLPDQVLAFVDRLAMAHSLEVRCPYLDTSLVEFLAHLPGSVKIHDGITKYLLKQAALRYFPDAMVNRRKEGFVLPVVDWLQSDLGEYVRETLSSERLARHGLFNPGYVARLVDGLFSERRDHYYANKILALIAFQEWHEAYL